MKKLISALLVILIFNSFALTSAAAKDNETSHPDIIYGDMNFDGIVSISDATMIQKFIARYEIYSILDKVYDLSLIDFDRSGNINILDVTTLTKYLSGEYNINEMIGKPAYIWSGDKYISIEEALKPTEITEPAETTEPAEATEPAETTEPTEATEPAETTEPTEATEPAETTEPTEATEPAETTEPAEATEPAETTQPTEATEPAETTQPTEATEPAETTEPTEATEPAETTEPTEATEPAETTEPTEATEPAETTQPTEATKPSNPENPPEVVPKMTDLYVSKDYTGNEADFGKTKFNSLFEANESITDNNENNRYTIHVADGIYTDLQERFAGVDDSQRAATEYCGVICKDYVYYEGNIENPSACTIEWDGKTAFSGNIVYKNVSKKAPFHLSKIKQNSLHTYIKGFCFNCVNLRYCLHIETSGAGREVEWQISDCIFNWGGNPDCADLPGKGSKAAIGAGHSPLERGEFNNCVINSATGYSYLAHDNRNGTAIPSNQINGAVIRFNNCDFNNGIFSCMSLKGDNVVNEAYKLIFTNCADIGDFKHTVSAPSTKTIWEISIV